MSRTKEAGVTTTQTNLFNTKEILYLVNQMGKRGKTAFFSGLMGWDGETTIVITNVPVFVIANQLCMSG